MPSLEIVGVFCLLKRKLLDLKYNKSICYILEVLYILKIWLDSLINRTFSCDTNVVRLSFDILKLCRLNWRMYEKYKSKCGINHLNETSGLYQVGYNDNACLKRLIILKEPIVAKSGKENEKGVLLAKFTDTFEFVIKNFDTRRLLKDYYLVLEPSWSGYADQRILYWTRHPKHTIIVQASEPQDFKFIQSLNSNLLPVSLGASDWVDDRVFYPLEGVEKKYDAIYVAVYAPYKRHQVIFRAIRNLNDKSLKLALVGTPWEGKRYEIQSLVNYYGLKGQVDFYENIGPPEVNHVLNQSKVNILLSLKEGSNKSIFEGFFAGIPAIVLKNNIGVNKQYINKDTGLLIDENELDTAIRHFQGNWNKYRTNQWAKTNISPKHTTAKLNGIIKNLALSVGEPWTYDVAIKVNSPEVRYYENNTSCDPIKILNSYIRKGEQHAKN